jgi:hypothetical protein
VTSTEKRQQLEDPFLYEKWTDSITINSHCPWETPSFAMFTAHKKRSRTGFHDL